MLSPHSEEKGLNPGLIQYKGKAALHAWRKKSGSVSTCKVLGWKGMGKTTA